MKHKSHSASIGGKFVAHGTRPPGTPISSMEAERKRKAGIESINANNAMQARLRPSGFVEDNIQRACPHCQRLSATKRAYINHTAECGSLAKAQMCPKCGEMFASRRKRWLHQKACCNEGAD